jgi:aldehyde dehydrogenase (NAD+)
MEGVRFGGSAVIAGGSKPEYRLFIDGEPVPAASGKTYDSVDPYTGEAWATVADGDAADVDRAVASARRALEGPWGKYTGFQRAALMRRLSEIIRRDADLLAELETRDTGKVWREMRQQALLLANWYDYFAGVADKIEGSTIGTSNPNFFVYTRPQPVGVVGAIVPWNSPLLLLTWKLAPALAAGCTVVAKPSEFTPAGAVELAARLIEAGFPPGVLNVVTGDGPTSGQALAGHPGIDKIAFTGSTAVGVEVARAAAANVVGALLELGGKSAHVVFEDADLEAVTNGVVAGVFAACGQTCLAGSRLLVHESVHDELVERIAARANRIVVGDPADPQTEMGPVANRRQYAKVVAIFETAKAEGAVAAAGGFADEDLGGFFVRPTVYAGVTPQMDVAREEVFGPVLAVLPFRTEEEAVALANDSEYGLAGAVWTKDIYRAHRVAHELRSGTVWINCYRAVDPAVPFGGMKASGIGRESGVESVNEYLETKSVWVELSGSTRDPFVLG